MTKQDQIAIRRFVAIRDAHDGLLPMKDMMHFCYEAKAPEFKKFMRALKKKSDNKTK